MCAAGRTDEDSDPTTQCVTCANGSYAVAIGSVSLLPVLYLFAARFISLLILTSIITCRRKQFQVGICTTCPANSVRESVVAIT